MNDETLKEQIDEIRKYLKKELSGETYVKASDKDEEVFIEYKPTKKALDRTMGMIERFMLQDRERAVKEAKLALVVDLEAKTGDGEWLSIWIENQYAQLSNPSQTKKTK